MNFTDGSTSRNPARSRKAKRDQADTKPYRAMRKRLSSLKPSPENLLLYSQIEENDPEIIKLADSISRHGLHEPLIVTADNFIVSGHRRYVALCSNDQVLVPCRVLNVRRDSMTKDEYTALLREHNRQRCKSVAEQVREEMVDIDPAEAHARLRNQRDKSIYTLEQSGVEPLEIEGNKTRHNISSQKSAHVQYVKQVVFEDRREYWPLSVRGCHYALLNYQFLRNIPRELPYRRRRVVSGHVGPHHTDAAERRDSLVCVR